MNKNNFNLINADTDSITISKRDGSFISKDEQQKIIKEINELFPEYIRFEHDGYYEKVVVLKAKNYVMYDGKKMKIKGSALKDAKREPAFKEFLNEILNAIIHDKNNFKEIYFKYLKEINNIKDIRRYCVKRSYTEKIDTSTRLNETKIKDAIKGTEYKQGDKLYLYTDNNDNLKLAEHYKNDYNKDNLVKKLFMASKVFQNILPTNELFLNYSLKKNKSLLEEILKNETINNG